MYFFNYHCICGMVIYILIISEKLFYCKSQPSFWPSCSFSKIKRFIVSWSIILNLNFFVNHQIIFTITTVMILKSMPFKNLNMKYMATLILTKQRKKLIPNMLINLVNLNSVQSFLSKIVTQKKTLLLKILIKLLCQPMMNKINGIIIMINWL